MVVAREQEHTLSHLRLVAQHPGFWELRALQRLDGSHMAARGSFFLIATQSGEDLIYDRLEHAAQWARAHALQGAELFIGMNPREREAKGKDAVSVLTSCYVDLDLPEGESQEEALAEVTSGDLPLPSFVINSGYGLHVVYLLREPTADKPLWKQVQRGLVHRLSDLGADRSVATDESRVLRLIPFPNRKHWPQGIATALLYESECRYRLTELAETVGTDEGGKFSRHEMLTFSPMPFAQDEGEGSGTLPTGEELQHRVEAAEGARFVLEAWIKRTMRPGLHYGIVPVDGHEPSKPTLLKPGAELVADLYGWRFHFSADLETLGMYGPGAAGIFAYVCTVIDEQNQTVGEGRGVAELREPGMNNANKTVKMAEKRAQVGAVLRCAKLSQWFTQDLEEPVFIAPEAREREQEGEARANGPHRPSPRTRRGDCCTPSQCRDIRMWLKMTGRSEEEILRFYTIERLEDLPIGLADKVIRRLMELRRSKSEGQEWLS